LSKETQKIVQRIQLLTANLPNRDPSLYGRHLSPLDWYGDYIQTYVERDVRQITAVQNLNLFQTFVRLCADRSWHAEARRTEEPGAGKLHVGIWAGAVG
jgi:hypothetical protein